MRKLRLLLIDNGTAERESNLTAFRDAADIEIAACTKYNKLAFTNLHQLGAQLVLVDLHIPAAAAVDVIREIMIVAAMPIIAVVPDTERDPAALSEQLRKTGVVAVLGALPPVLAPCYEQQRLKLLASVRAMAGVKVVRQWRRNSEPPQPPAKGAAADRDVRAVAQLPGGSGRCRLVAMAASTGGPAALQHLLQALPRTYPLPILVVQHITVGFTASLVAWLKSVCAVRVKVAEEDEAILPQTVYFAPDDRHLGVSKRGTIMLAQIPPIDGFRPSATHLFNTAAQAYGDSLTAIILTGMGNDGVAGLAQVRKLGGTIIAQDEKSSIVFGMPGAAVAAGLAGAVLSLDDIHEHLMALIGQSQEKASS